MADDWRKPITERVKNFTDILEKEKGRSPGKGLPKSPKHAPPLTPEQRHGYTDMLMEKRKREEGRKK